jgi:hypothetical protein
MDAAPRAGYPQGVSPQEDQGMAASRRSFQAAVFFAGAIVLGLSSQPASAAVLTLTSPVQAGLSQTEIQAEPIQYYRWDRRYHGPRYRYRRPGFTFYYDGYYYSRPWWQTRRGPPRYAPRYYDRAQHVSWCLSRYRSYNADSDSFLGYDGRYHRCRSPYSD